MRTAVFALTLFVAGAAVAQAPVEPAQAASTHVRHHHDAAGQARHLTKKLGLSADQAAQLQPILADRDQKMQALRAGSAGSATDPKSIHQQQKAIAHDADQKLTAILTPGQQQQYAAMKAAHHHDHGRQMPTATPPPAA